MFHGQTTIRIHYALTDQMGVVYYGNYAQFFEIGRTEATRLLGFTYKELESMGVIMPVSHMDIYYKKPIVYDEIITVHTILRENPSGAKMTFHGEIYNEKGDLCSRSAITLYFVDVKTKKPIPIPDELAKVLKPYFP